MCLGGMGLSLTLSQRPTRLTVCTGIFPTRLHGRSSTQIQWGTHSEAAAIVDRILAETELLLLSLTRLRVRFKS